MVFATKNQIYKIASSDSDKVEGVEYSGDAEATQSISSIAVLPNGEVAFSNPDRLKIYALKHHR